MLHIIDIFVSVVRVEIDFYFVIFTSDTGFTFVEIYEKHRTRI